MIYTAHRFHVADPSVAAVLRRDGFGWDVDGSSLMVPADRPRGALASLWDILRRRIHMSRLEHVNITVADPKKTAAMLSELFGWHTRWEGSAMNGAGYTVHVGDDDSYVAVYSGSNPEQTILKADASYQMRGGLNHLGVVVDDLDAVEARVKSMGLQTHSHADYEPGRRFYFHDHDGVEIEVVSYA